MCRFGLIKEIFVAIRHILTFQEKSGGLQWILGYLSRVELNFQGLWGVYGRWGHIWGIRGYKANPR